MSTPTSICLDKGASIYRIDEGLKNKWNWSWLEEKDCLGDVIGIWCRKTNRKGEAFCVPCGKVLRYASGKCDIKRHASTTNKAGVNKHAEEMQSYREKTKALSSLTQVIKESKTQVNDKVC